MIVKMHKNDAQNKYKITKTTTKRKENERSYWQQNNRDILLVKMMNKLVCKILIDILKNIYRFKNYAIITNYTLVWVKPNAIFVKKAYIKFENDIVQNY